MTLNRLHNLKVILTKLEEVAGQNIFIQIVVRQIQNLENGESTEAAKMRLMKGNPLMSRAAAWQIFE